MSDPAVTLQRLRALIGQRVHYEGLDCQIIEVLEDGPSLVLQEQGVAAVVQDNQHGEGHRRVAPTLTLRVHDALSGQINPLLHALLDARRQQ